MVEHIVLLKFRPDVPQDVKDEVARQLRGLASEIPGIVELHCGHNFSHRSQGYDMGLVVRFVDRAALEAYQPHPAHQRVVAYMDEVGLVDKLVVDFELEA